MKLSTVFSLTAVTLVSFSSAAPLIGALVAPLALDVIASTGPSKEIISGIKNTTKGILGKVPGDDEDEESKETQLPEEDNTSDLATDDNSSGLVQAGGPQIVQNAPQLSPAVVPNNEVINPQTLSREDSPSVDETQQLPAIQQNPTNNFNRVPTTAQGQASGMDVVN